MKFTIKNILLALLVPAAFILLFACILLSPLTFLYIILTITAIIVTLSIVVLMILLSKAVVDEFGDK